MTEAKKFKQAVRARSRKTGESYTAARKQLYVEQARLVSKAASPDSSDPQRPLSLSTRSAGTTDPPAIGDAAIVKKTGHGYDHWFAVLDTFDVKAKGHAAAATHLAVDHGVPGWHGQMITVAYERVRGLRAVNQSCAGDFQVSVSKTVPASVSDVVASFNEISQRSVWLRSADAGLARALNAALSGPREQRVKVKDARNARLRYAWQGTTVEIRISATAKGGASVVADNTKLGNAAEVDERRALWRAALDSLKTHLLA